MDRNGREQRDAAGVGPYAQEREKLLPLSSLESWTVSDGEPDIRGWEITRRPHNQIRLPSNSWDRTRQGLFSRRRPPGSAHTFVPIRVVQIDRARRVVLMDSADLPVSAIERDGSSPAPARRANDVLDARTVRYPRTDREVVVERPVVADDVRPRDATPRGELAGSAIDERRRAERRRIQRVSTDI
jgi:hypothetical protein